jgi:hypothetical protein
MRRFGQYLFATGQNATNGTTPASTSTSPAASEENPDRTHIPEPSHHQPSVGDVLKVKEYLLEGFDVPLELIDNIIDFAEYWPHTTSITTPIGDDEPPVIVRSGDARENILIVC